MTTSVVLYFQVHQPWRIRPYSVFEVGESERWFDDRTNRRIVRRVAERCYLPTNRLLLDLVERHEGRFRFAFSISGTALTQMERWSGPSLTSFKRLARTGAVEFLAETSHHSLSFLRDEAEFARQVRDHADRVEALFGRRPTAFRNTELIVDNRVARVAERLGFRCLLAEGADHVLKGRSPYRVYRAAGCRSIRYLLRAYRHSDDVAFRFGDGLTASGFAADLAAPARRGEDGADVLGLFMDFETFGEHKPAESGIFRFLEEVPSEVLATGALEFRTPTEAVALHPVRGTFDVRRPMSWADTERDLTAWLGNPMQDAAHHAVHALGRDVRRVSRKKPDLLERWRRLTTSDHFYYMCTKWFADGDVHKYFSPWASPHDAYIAYMNVVEDLAARVRKAARPRRRPARTLPLSPASAE